MTLFLKACFGAAVLAVTAAGLDVSDMQRMSQRGKLQTGMSPKEIRHIASAVTATDNKIEDDHNGTVKVRFSTDFKNCADTRETQMIPAEKCLKIGDGRSGVYSCGIQAVNVLRATEYKRSVPAVCPSEDDRGARAIICDQCEKLRYNTSLGDYIRFQCLHSTTESGVRLLDCPDSRCETNSCRPLFGGKTGTCAPFGEVDFFIKSVETGGLIFWGEWSNEECRGDLDEMAILPVSACDRGMTLTCDNHL